MRCYALLPGSSKQGIEPESLMSPAMAGKFFTTSATWEAEDENHTVRKMVYRREWLSTPVLPWRIPWTEELDRLQPKVGHV